MGFSTSFASFGGFLACLWVLDGCQAGGLTYLPTVCHVLRLLDKDCCIM
jgi:hypothetical protein